MHNLGAILLLLAVSWQAETSHLPQPRSEIDSNRGRNSASTVENDRVEHDRFFRLIQERLEQSRPANSDEQSLVQLATIAADPNPDLGRRDWCYTPLKEWARVEIWLTSSDSDAVTIEQRNSTHDWKPLTNRGAEQYRPAPDMLPFDWQWIRNLEVPLDEVPDLVQNSLPEIVREIQLRLLKSGYESLEPAIFEGQTRTRPSSGQPWLPEPRISLVWHRERRPEMPNQFSYVVKIGRNEAEYVAITIGALNRAVDIRAQSWSSRKRKAA